MNDLFDVIAAGAVITSFLFLGSIVLYKLFTLIQEINNEDNRTT